MRINININELNFNGLNFSDREQVALAIKHELITIIKEKKDVRNLIFKRKTLEDNNHHQISKKTISSIKGSFEPTSRDADLLVVSRSIARSIYDGLDT